MSASLHPLVADLWTRRLGSAAAAERFLRASLDDVPDPVRIPHLAAAAERIGRAVRARERVIVFGHDDPDGITSCAVLVETLEALGGTPQAYIPDRNREGHGLYPGLVRRFASAGAKLCVTTDGCSSNVDEVKLAAALGLDVIVTDHHVVAEGRPAVPGLVNPMADPETAAEFGDLTGVGVAALLARKLLPKRFERLLDLVALGTLADWGDVSRSNRAMVVRGLSACADGVRPSVAEAMRQLHMADPFGWDDARRLAAVFASIPSSVDGRSRGLDALLGRPGSLADVADLVSALLATEAEIASAVEDGLEAARARGVLDGKPAVLRLDGGSPRAPGALAAALVARTGRPAAVLQDRDTELVGELRAPDGTHLVEVLGGMRELLSSWGGHRRAAGFSASLARGDEIVAWLAGALDVPPAREPRPAPEARVASADVDGAFLESLHAARPFGRGNPAPVIAVDGVARAAEELLADRTGVS